MVLIKQIKKAATEAVKVLYNKEFLAEDIIVNTTKPEFEGDYTVVIFPFSRLSKKKPEETGKEIGDYFINKYPQLFSNYNVIKGFLNLSINEEYWKAFLLENFNNKAFGLSPSTGKKIMVEFSSPNTNKPLHLGHLRNNFLGYSISKILEAAGNEVIKANLVNDRGVHICKSMVAWRDYGQQCTPDSTGIKGDHLVGDYYVKFNEIYQQQIGELVASGMDKKQAEKEAPLMRETQKMLQKWEAGDPGVRELWSRMNSWVYEGFDETYRRLGISFDKVYYESQTYLLGKEIILDGLDKGIFYKKEDGSAWIDLSADGMDEKLLLRGDGTSVYITQDLGTAQLKYDDYQVNKSVYVIGDEQNYHMQVLRLILQKLEKPYADGIYHLSYGMVELPSGKMKSREGTVVDADDIIDEMVSTAQRHTAELGKVKDFNEKELKELYAILGIGAMKFYLLRVDPKKRMVFNPEESIDFHGYTGPFVQYTYARIKSIFRKENIQEKDIPAALAGTSTLLALEREVIFMLEQFETIIQQAADEMNPSVIANYVFQIAKTFNSFYTEHSINKAESEEKKQLRLQLCLLTANVIAKAMELLGINVPERM